jgi:hypothetical protein
MVIVERKQEVRSKKQEISDEYLFAVDTLRRLCFARGDTKRLDALITILVLAFEDTGKAAANLLEFVDTFERVLKSERMEILYPFEKVKIANHEFGSTFLEGYFDWDTVSYDPYEQLALAEKMLEDIEVAKGYVRNVMRKLKELPHGSFPEGSSPLKGGD